MVNVFLMFAFLLPVLNSAAVGQGEIPVRTLRATCGLESVVFSPDGTYIAACACGTTKRLQVATGACMRDLEHYLGWVSVVALSSDGSYLAGGTLVGPIAVWNLQSETLAVSLKGHTGPIQSLAFSPLMSLLASGSCDSTIKLWELPSGQLLRTLQDHTGGVRSVAFSPDGRYLASGGDDNSIRLWDVFAAQLFKTVRGHLNCVNAVTFSPDGKYLATASSDKSAALWDAIRLKLIKSLTGHTDFVKCVAFSPDGRYLATGSEDHTIKLWEVSTGRLLNTLTGLYGHDDYVSTIAFSAGGDLLARGSRDHSIRLWDVSHLGVQPVVVSAPVVQELPSLTMNVDADICKSELSNPDGVAVVMGNQRYEHKDVPPVQFAINDASIFREYLVKTLGLKPGNIIFETDANLATFNAIFGTKDNPKGKLYRYVKPNISDVYIYYSGHGAPDPDNKVGYFLPVDCDPSVVALNGYSLDTFYDNLKKLPARSVTVILDACFSGVSEGGQLLKGISPVFIEATQGAGLPGGTIFTSAEKDQVSTWYEEKKHGLFTYFFLCGLRGLADINKDGSITVAEMADFLQDRAEGVPYWAGRLKNREQTPTVFGDRNRVLVKY